MSSMKLRSGKRVSQGTKSGKDHLQYIVFSRQKPFACVRNSLTSHVTSCGSPTKPSTVCEVHAVDSTSASDKKQCSMPLKVNLTNSKTGRKRRSSELSEQKGYVTFIALNRKIADEGNVLMSLL